MKRFLFWFTPILILLTIGASVAWRFWPRLEPFEFDLSDVRMAVANGCGVRGLAAAVTDRLHERGYNVYEVGNDDRRDSTTVLDLRDPTGETARCLARTMATQPKFWFVPFGDPVMPLSEVALDSSRYLEAVLVIGSDYRSFFPDAKPLH